MWLALAGKKVWLLVLATSLDTMIGGMGQAAFVAFLVSLCSADFSATQYALLSALAVLPRNVTGAIAGPSGPGDRLGEFFRGHLPERGAGAHLAGDVARALERTRGARSRAKAARAVRPTRPPSVRHARNDGSAAQRAVVAAWTKGCARCLRTRDPSLRFHVDRARPIFRRIGRIDEMRSSSCSFQESKSISVTVPSKY